jgi:hypothetical protein
VNAEPRSPTEAELAEWAWETEERSGAEPCADADRGGWETYEQEWAAWREEHARPPSQPNAWDAPGYVPDFYFWTPEHGPEAALAQEKSDPWYWPGQDGEPPTMEELGLDPNFLPDGEAYDSYLMACENAAIDLEIAAEDAQLDREWLRRDPRWLSAQRHAVRRPAGSLLRALRPQRHRARRRRETAGRRTQRARAPARSDPDDPDPPRVARRPGGRISVVRRRAAR